jgi:hypothetical protein
LQGLSLLFGKQPQGLQLQGCDIGGERFMAGFNFRDVQNSRVNLQNEFAEVAGQVFGGADYIQFGEIGNIPGGAIAQAARRYQEITRGGVNPQLAALVFDVTGDLRALDWYLAITNMLRENDAERRNFYSAIRYIAENPNLNARIYAENRRDITAQTPPAVRYLIAGQLAEVFYYRRDILDRFLSYPRNFLIYTNRTAFDQDGGLAGGDYNFGMEAIQLEMSRLFEGYNGKTPGVCPFLHELGHMLDHFEGGTGRMGTCEGILPGMANRDGAIFTPEARRAFAEGKAIEQQRYILYQNNPGIKDAPLPIGHPYVFQTDGEFIAGYLEMFFRNPHYFAKQNPALFQGFASLFRQDPRAYWQEDFPLYVNENRNFYLRPSPQNISIPAV